MFHTILRFSAIIFILYLAAREKLPTDEIVGIPPETAAAVIIALLLAPTLKRMME